MPNGDSLLGHWSSTQAAIIVPLPGSDEYFYVFTTDAFYGDDLRNGFRYSIVDMCMDNGLGDIKPGQKNILLLDTVAEKLTAVNHANGNDYWIITHKYYSDAFYAYHLSAAGIVDTVISHIGTRHPVISANQSSGASIGQLKASPDGRKLAIVNGQTAVDVAEYFDFDNATGVVSNCVSVQTNPIISYYGVSFSPDNSKLYISAWLNANGIFQFDLNAGNGDPDSVRASRTLITPNTYYGLQLGVDGKIYAAIGGNYLSVINNPNNAGMSCNYAANAVYLSPGTCSYGLPNFIDSYNYSNKTSNCAKSGIDSPNGNQALFIYPNPSNGIFTIANADPISSIKVYDALGQLILFTSQSVNQIDLSMESDGIYFVRMETDEKIITEKLVISK